MLFIYLLMGLLLSLMIERALIVSRLRKYHQETWQALGAPFPLVGGKPNQPFFQFIGFRGTASRLGDGTLTFLVSTHRLTVVLIGLDVIAAFVGCEFGIR